MGSKRRSSDIISLLVSIYGSKDIFIDEYRAVLADRLLHQLNYNTARYNQHALNQGSHFLVVLTKVVSKVSRLLFFMCFCPLLCVCREIRNVELLKLRFGESHMHYCEVMLKVNTAGLCSSVILTTTIISESCTDLIKLAD